MRHDKDEFAADGGGADQTFDLISAIGELSGLGSQELTKLLKDSENFTIQLKTEKGSFRQIDMEKLASSLPLHLLAVLLSADRNISMEHVLCGLRLLHTLSDLATRRNILEQILLDDVKLSEQIMDLVFFTLIVLAHHQQDNLLGAFPLLHSALVACSLHLLSGFISSQWHDLVLVLLAHPKVDLFMDVAFDALHEDIMILYVKLRELNDEVLSNKCNLSAAERTVYFISQQCEASLQFLLFLCQQKLFRDRVLRNKELCKQGGILYLAHAVLQLNVPQCFQESSHIVASLSRLKAKVLSILLQLCEAESISYLDEVAGSPKSMHLAKSVALKFLELLRTAFKKEGKQLGDSHYRNNQTGLVLLNALRLADIFSDDSNFRSFFMTNTIPVLAEILAAPHEEFSSNWCSLKIPIIEEDSNIEYDPFTAAGVALVALNLASENAHSTPYLLTDTNCVCPFNSNSMPSATYAQQRTSCLVKIIANLHVFVPNICEEEESDLFLNKFYSYLLMEGSESSQNHFTFDVKKTATVCRNLSSLSQYAASLTPIFLNDEDVDLVSVYADKLQKLTRAQVGDSLVQETKIRDEGDNIKFEDVYPAQQSSVNWTKDFVGSSPYMLRKLDGSIQEDAAKFSGIVYLKGATRESSIYQTPDQINRSEEFAIEMDSNKIDLDLVSDGKEFFKSECGKESGIQDDEKAESGQAEEKQPRKRKRNIMNDRQINLIEKALLDEPEMQKNATLLQTWADKLSSQGSEITSSQLKNWLNNRKARLARAAKEAPRAPSEGETSYPDKTCGPSMSNFYDSPESAASEEMYAPPSRGSSHQTIPKSGGMTTRAASCEDAEMITQNDSIQGNKLSCLESAKPPFR